MTLEPFYLARDFIDTSVSGLRDGGVADAGVSGGESGRVFEKQRPHGGSYQVELSICRRKCPVSVSISKTKLKQRQVDLSPPSVGGVLVVLVVVLQESCLCSSFVLHIPDLDD